MSDQSLFYNVSKLIVNEDIDKRWLPFIPTENNFHRDEIGAAQWYQETVKKEITTTDGSEFLVPIIFYIDKTGTDLLCRHSLEPLMFTIGIFDRSIRNQAKAWRMLGLMPDLEATSSAAKAESNKSILGKGFSSRNYHKCLDQILQSFKNAQEKASQGKLTMWIRIGPNEV